MSIIKTSTNTKRLILQHVDYYKTLNTTNVQYYRILHCVGLGRVKKLFGPSTATFCIIDSVIPSLNNRHFVSLCSEKSIRNKGIESEPNLVNLRYFKP